MSKKRFYAVKKGREPGIYTTWAECKEQVDGFPSAQHHSFATEEEAKAYLEDTALPKKEKEESLDCKKEIHPSYDSDDIPPWETDTFSPASSQPKVDEGNSICIKAFTEGFYEENGENPPKAGYGVIFVKENQVIGKIRGSCKERGLKQIAGEINAVATAIKYTKRHQVEKLEVCQNSADIEKWGVGKKDCALPETKKYRNYIKQMKKEGLKITFSKPENSDMRFVELAQQCAKEGASAEKEEGMGFPLTGETC